MSRYIDVDKIRLTIPSCVDEEGDVYVLLSDVRRALAQTPTADVVEVRHGYWLERNDEWFDFYECSECGRKISIYKKEPYCHCGAKMDGERSKK